MSQLRAKVFSGALHHCNQAETKVSRGLTLILNELVWSCLYTSSVDLLLLRYYKLPAVNRGNAYLREKKEKKIWNTFTEHARSSLSFCLLLEKKCDVKNQCRACASVGACAAQGVRGDATAGLRPSINSPQHILLTWPALGTSLYFPFLFFSAFITFCYSFRDLPSDILGCGSAESWAGGPWIQNPGGPGPVQRTAGSGHALWGEGPSPSTPGDSMSIK